MGRSAGENEDVNRRAEFALRQLPSRQMICSRKERLLRFRGPQMTEKRAMCLRCDGVELVPSGPFGHEIQFFDCPACHRRYARKPGGSLTFRWLHPISLVLYGKLFDSSGHSPIEKSSVPSEPPEMLLRMVEEIELELTHPTQQVRDILDNPQTEEQCRQYLREYVTMARVWLREKQNAQG